MLTGRRHRFWLVYQDPQVVEISEKHYEELIAEVLQTAWLDEDFAPTALNALPRVGVPEPNGENVSGAGGRR